MHYLWMAMPSHKIRFEQNKKVKNFASKFLGAGQPKETTLGERLVFL